jgi:hypothetical protein
MRSWGGARAGAGRRAGGPIASEPHRVRPALSHHHPVRVTARFVRGVSARARRRLAYRAVRRAIAISLARADFRIVALELRTGSVELVCEAADRIALARGMQGFEVSAARWLNRAIGRRGGVFADRYRARILATRDAIRAALAELDQPERPAFPQTWLVRKHLHAPAARTRARGS